MADTGTPPVIPTAFQQYNSYVIDPQWQRTFSIVWASFAAGAILFSLPYLIRSIRNGRAFTGFFGVSENWDGYTPIPQSKKTVRKPAGSRRRIVAAVVETMGAMTFWTPPGLPVNVGQIILMLAYFSLVIVCIIMNSVLDENSNRAGFMAIALLPPTILLSTKNSIVSLLLGPGNGYEKLNFLHRASGRLMFISAVIHGSLWIRNHLAYNLPILGQQKETSGVAAFGLLCVIVLTSIKPVRQFSYQAFYIIHQLAFPSFFITVCYHTLYASPWIFPPLAFYGADVLMRMMRIRIKDAGLVDVQGRGELTLIRIKNCDAGWEAGQHIRLRVFFGGRMFESHPLTIMNGPSSSTCLSSSDGSASSLDAHYSHQPGTLLLGARVSGDWTRALNGYAKDEAARLAVDTPDSSHHGQEKRPQDSEVPVQVMMSGPYGGSSIDLGQYERVLLFSGGSGATFTIGLLDELVARCVLNGRAHGERTKRVEFVWCIRGFAALDWFSPVLKRIAHVAAQPDSDIAVHMSIYVTCLCNPDAVPDIPNFEVRVKRPTVYSVLSTFAGFAQEDAEKVDAQEDEDDDVASVVDELALLPLGGGVGVCASGPRELVREASNAVARMSMIHGLKLGGIGLHTEAFDL